MAPFDSLRSLMAGQPLADKDHPTIPKPIELSTSSESNALSKRSASKGHLPTASAPADSSFFVYILRCADGSFYVGHTANLAERIETHNAGRGAAWTACRRPVALVYSEPFPSEGDAVRREIQFKGWTHAKKCALAAGDLARLKSLAKRRVR